MTEYALYVESGPRRRKTMVHVVDLLGCIAQGPTTDDALEATPDAIRAFMRFLKRHGDAVEPDGRFTTAIVAHVMEGSFIGQGDPAPGFAPDFEPLSALELKRYVQRLDWIHEDLLRVIDRLTPRQLTAEPQGGGRPVYHILQHVSEAQCAYLRYAAGKVDGLAEAARAVRERPDDVASALSRVWQISEARWAAMTADERNRRVPHGQLTWTARRGLRRALEHDWEHLQELSRRLER
jgi:uncharacterized damage-inducible protein DinB/predicted RNase H-like HicB family nuclease